MGRLGLDPFRLIMNDTRFRDVPKIIETPKEGNPEMYDRINLDTLLGLIRPGDRRVRDRLRWIAGGLGAT